MLELEDGVLGDEFMRMDCLWMKLLILENLRVLGCRLMVEGFFKLSKGLDLLKIKVRVLKKYIILFIMKG